VATNPQPPFYSLLPPTSGSDAAVGAQKIKNGLSPMQGETCQGTYTGMKRCAINTVISDDTQDLATGFLDGSIADNLAQCDELKPCSNCARHGVLCSLTDANAPPVPTIASSSSSGSTVPRTTTKPKTVRLTCTTVAKLVNLSKHTGNPGRQCIISDTLEECRPINNNRAVRWRLA
jgi:hypothetical protein